MNFSLKAMVCFLMNQSKNIIIFQKVDDDWVRVNTKFFITEETILRKQRYYGRVRKGKEIALLVKMKKIFKHRDDEKDYVARPKYDSFEFTMEFKSLGQIFHVYLPETFAKMLPHYGLYRHFGKIRLPGKEKKFYHHDVIHLYGIYVYFILYFCGVLNTQNKKQFNKYLLALDQYLK